MTFVVNKTNTRTNKFRAELKKNCGGNGVLLRRRRKTMDYVKGTRHQFTIQQKVNLTRPNCQITKLQAQDAVLFDSIQGCTIYLKPESFMRDMRQVPY